MEELFNAFVHCLAQVNPLYATLAVAAWVLFGDRLKGLLGRIKLPTLPKTPAVPAEPKKEDESVEDWLEKHPLLDRLWVRLKDKFQDKVLTGEVDEDELYLKLLKAIRESE